MPKYWKTNEFKRLEAFWDEKLAASGFVDAEKRIGDDRVLSQNSTNVYRQASELARNSKKIYYDLLNECINKKNLRSKIDQLIMPWHPDAPVRLEQMIIVWHAEGFKKKEICEQLREIGESRHRQTVMFIIRKYEHKWKIKKWTKEKLDPKWRHYKK